MSKDDRKIGKLALEWGGCAFELKVLESTAGYYLGTVDGAWDALLQRKHRLLADI